MPDLFDGDPIHAPGSRRAPTDLNPAQWQRLRLWAEAYAPWITRTALGSLTPLEEHVDACLGHFRATRFMRVDWCDSVIEWIRRAERPRLERLARSGSDAAKLALLKPIEWRNEFDRKQRTTAALCSPTELIVPSDGMHGAKVVSLAARRSA